MGDPANGRVSSRGNVSNRRSPVYSKNPHWNDSQPNLLLPNKDAPVQAKYPHIKDLQAKADAAVNNIDPRIPVGQDSIALVPLLVILLLQCAKIASTE